MPVLVLTARRSAEDEAIARQAGANGYLGKPFDPERLIGKVNQILDGAHNRKPTEKPAVHGV